MTSPTPSPATPGSPSSAPVDWQAKRDSLAAFVAAHGRLPHRDEQWQGFRPHRWMEKQQAAGRAGMLTPRQAQDLEAIPGWYWRRNTRMPWDAAFTMLTTFVAAHGRLPKMTEVTGDGFKIGAWVKEQRVAAQRPAGAGRLTEDRRRRLETVPGWTWQGRRGAPVDQERWLTRYRQVRAYIDTHGHRPTAGPLADWLKAQPGTLRQHEHAEERRRLLAELPA